MTTPTLLFRHRSEKVPSTARGLAKLARDVSADGDLARLEGWAKRRLKSAGLSTSWKSSVKTAKGRSLNLALVPKDSVEWLAAQVLFYVNGTRAHLKSRNAPDAVWCALRAMEHYWLAVVEGKLARSYVVGQKQLAGSRKGQAARGANSAPRRALVRQLLAEHPRNPSLAFHKAARELGIAPDSVRRRYR